MSNNKIIFEIFKQRYLIPNGYEAIRWRSAGKNAIKVDISNGECLIFTYYSYNDWRIESVKNTNFLNK